MKKIKDPISGFSHLAGAIASIVGLVFLIIYAAKYGEGAWDVVSFTIFGSGLVLLYTASSVYHLCNVSPKATKVLRKLDHIMIYILIAATYVNCQAKINKNSHIKLSNYSQVKKYILSTGIIQHSFYL